jgi:hypothetical protein
MDETPKAYIETSINLLEIVTEQYGILPHLTIMKDILE